jgi:hypothetical protein
VIGTKARLCGDVGKSERFKSPVFVGDDDSDAKLSADFRKLPHFSSCGYLGVAVDSGSLTRRRVGGGRERELWSAKFGDRIGEDTLGNWRPCLFVSPCSLKIEL